MGKKVLITGSSSGFGKLTVQTLIKNGHVVAASMRDPKGKNSGVANELQELGAHIVELDVTSEASVEKGATTAVKEMKGLDAVVNNAGIGVLGMQEHFNAEEWQKLFNVNVFGVHRMIRAIAPHMREQKSGLIINVSSLLGRITLPFYGPYNASKWAVEAMAENYRYELSGFGVDVCLVEPGGYPTNFFDNLITPSDKTREKSYGEFMNVPKTMFENFEKALAQNPSQNPQDVADAILKLVDTPAGQRPMRTVVDKMGMGDALGSYNQLQQEITKNIFGNFGMDEMLSVKTNLKKSA